MGFLGSGLWVVGCELRIVGEKGFGAIAVCVSAFFQELVYNHMSFRCEQDEVAVCDIDSVPGNLGAIQIMSCYGHLDARACLADSNPRQWRAYQRKHC